MNKLKTICLSLLISGVVFSQQHPLLKEFKSFDWQHFNSKTASPEMKKKVNEYMELINQINLDSLNRTSGDPQEIKSLIINGNKITTIVYNYGSITRPNVGGNVYDLVWNRLGYGYEFAALVSAEVVKAPGDTIRIVDDGLWLASQGDYSPSGLKWGWLPTAGYAQSGQPDVAAWSHRKDVNGDLTRKPHSWPESWYNPGAGRYVWPAFLGNDASTPDEEVYFVMDDYTNREFPYYPFPNDSTKRGLGVDLECRYFQFNNPLAEDIIFLVYRVTNRSPKTLPKVWLGMYGDPHVGGPNSFNDDLFGFYGPKDTTVSQRARNITYAWDFDSRGDGGLPTGYFGFKFLESPTNSTDGKDNDDDGIIDESPFNDAGVYIDGTIRPLNFGIADTNKYKRLYGSPKPRWSGDENGDWSIDRDDVGLDGIPETGDFGEGNGKPDIGRDANNNITAEPNFGIRDVNESDQIGLTSFWAAPFSVGYPKDDPLYFERLSRDTIDVDPNLIATPGDNIFLYGSGPFSLEPGGTQRFSIALLMGDNLQDLLLNSETAQRVLEANYRFAQPPPKPNLRAVAGDKRVTLYWDNISESTVDPLTGTKDFEGYKIYRSEDPTFADVYTITDANGSPFLGSPFTQSGIPAQFDVKDNGWQGLHPVPYINHGIQYQLGSNTGLVHEYIDSSVTNGKTYYYAVASYDHGLDSLGVALPPSESQIAILRDAITHQLTYDVNTAGVTPGPLSAGSTKAGLQDKIARTKGIATGSLRVQVLDDLAVPDNLTYTVSFDSVSGKVAYSVKAERTYNEKFISRDTLYVPLSRSNLIESSITVLTSSGATVPASQYRVDAKGGRIRGSSLGSLPNNQQFEIRYQYYAVFQSNRLQGEDGNPVFDGLRLYTNSAVLGIDSANSRWLSQPLTNLVPKVFKPTALPTAPFIPEPLDFQIRWNRTDRDARGKWLFPGDTLLNNNGRKVVVCPFKIVNITDTTSVRILVSNAQADSVWKPGREIFFITPAKFAPQTPIPGMLGVNFFVLAPGDTIYPAEGSIYEVKTTKPFTRGDEYTFTSQSVRIEPVNKDSLLNRIYVVPNPYVAYSLTESPGGTSSQRGINDLQFRNLPTKCTIRIYTMVGELVATIDKDDDTSMARWNVLTNEGQRLAYGIYLYHVDAPTLGQKIGRIALIK